MGAFINMIILIFLRETFASFYTKDIQVFNIATHLLLYGEVLDIVEVFKINTEGEVEEIWAL